MTSRPQNMADIKAGHENIQWSTTFQIDVKMESWLVDVKRVRIPRPKFGGSSRCYPAEPPKDYIYEDRPEELKLKAGTNLVKATEDLRRALQEKL